MKTRTRNSIIIDCDPVSNGWTYKIYLEYKLAEAIDNGAWDDAIDLGLELNGLKDK